ncbi:MAG TPA: serine hydrolase [Lacipirellulaceae bacterium]|nr:serine hydrolase [Lacipirellulaceae bacterium]
MGTRHGIAWLSFLCASILLPGAAWSMDASCASAPQQLDDWETASPEDVGFDAAVLCKITQELAAQGPFSAARPNRRNVHAVLVVRHGKLVFEAYAAGKDENWGEPLGVVPHDAATKHDVMSISKSVVSLLFGIALERKLIAGTDIPVLPFFPEYDDPKKPKWDKILLRHLLTMTPGYDWNEDTAWMDPYNTERAMFEAADPYRYILGREVVHEPDARWQYNSGATTLLGAVLKKATGKSLDEFAKEALFDPLHIQDVEWATMLNGDPAAAGGLRLRPRDLAKIGQLVLNGGTWHGQRIVPEDWVKQSTTPRFDAGGSLQYGYQWWFGTSWFGAGRTVDWIAAFGLGGQRIFIVPTLDLVVVTNAGLYADGGQSAIVRSVFEYRVLPAIRDPVQQ